MRLRNKLIIVFLFLAIVPLSTAGQLLLQFLETQIVDQRNELRDLRLQALSHRLGRSLDGVAENLRYSFSSFDLQHLKNSERQGLLRLLYSQRPHLNAIQLLDNQGQDVGGGAVFLSDPANLVGPLAKHVPIDARTLGALSDPILLADAATNGVSWANPVLPEGSERYQLPFALAFQDNGLLQFTAVGLISLELAIGSAWASEACVDPQSDLSNTAEPSPSPCVVYLLDAGFRTVLSYRARGVPPPLDVPETFMKVMTGRRGGEMTMKVDDVEQVLVGFPLPGPPLSVVTVEPKAESQRALSGPVRTVTYWSLVSMLIAVVFGTYFSRTITIPVQALADGVLEVARGNLEAKVEVTSSDEIGKLAETFNYMADRLRHQQAEIERQGEEIRSWNLTLQQRVEERTRELNEAQGYLIHTQKLAAVAELGSGVAHELNNPLSVVLGFTQIMIGQREELLDKGEKVDEYELGHLKRMEEQTLRCREIVQHLLRFSQEQIDRGAYDTVDLAEILGSVLALYEGTLTSRKIRVENHLQLEELLSWGNRAQLLQAFVQLFSAVRTVIGQGQHLTIEGRRTDEGLQMVLSGPLRSLSNEQGRPFQAHVEQDQAMAQGLSLWLARKILQEHHGTLEIEVPAGTADIDEARLVISLPSRARARAQGAAPRLG